MKPGIRFTLGLLALLSAVPAQPANNPAVASKIDAGVRARGDAIDDLKQGNPTAALAKLRAATKHSARASSDDLQVVGELCSIARELEAASPGSGRAVALTAAAEGAKARPGLSRKEAAALEAHLGELHESVLGDPAKARIFYQSALTLEATRQDARLGLQRLVHLEALIQAKAQENAALRRRGK